jgi:hypothetical protein
MVHLYPDPATQINTNPDPKPCEYRTQCHFTCGISLFSSVEDPQRFITDLKSQLKRIHNRAATRPIRQKKLDSTDSAFTPSHKSNFVMHPLDFNIDRNLKMLDSDSYIIITDPHNSLIHGEYVS